MTIGNRIKFIRGSLSQKDFAKKIGVHVYTVQLYETGNIPKGDVLQRIHKKVGVSIDWLLTGEGEPYIDDRKKDEDVCVKEPGAPYNAREREGEKRGTEILGAKPPEGSIHEQFKLSKALTAAARVLESKTSYAVALYINIQHFDRAIHAETRIIQLEQKNEKLEKRMSILEKKLLETEVPKRSADESGERKAA